ncbi:hypothetical protein [Neosynechococcus sphagnicola]|uniref:hypothetical protein n=1 Tax=Neosynechococcus sphagnicola TaxID=1501145 RepID=UPI001EF9F4FE|nr:hypothetical protein [Neosynechococcus sphagnicola]
MNAVPWVKIENYTEMNSQHRQRYRAAVCEADLSVSWGWVVKTDILNQDIAKFPQADQILEHLQNGHLLTVSSRRRNGLILGKPYYAEFAGPGAVVGGIFDLDCQWIIPVGDLSLVSPESYDERQKAYLIRRQWIRLTQQFTGDPAPLQRAHMILNQLENYFDADTITQLPDAAVALLVGVFPDTITALRRGAESLHSRDGLRIAS